MSKSKNDFHQIVSFVKSGLRVLGLTMIIFNLIIGGLLTLILAEAVGVLEEFGQ
jgi:hypothetical protein